MYIDINILCYIFKNIYLLIVYLVIMQGQHLPVGVPERRATHNSNAL